MPDTDHGQKLAEQLLAAALQRNTDCGSWQPDCAVIKRLLDDKTELRCVWNELWRKTNNEKQFNRVLNEIVDVAAGWGPEQQKEHRDAKIKFSDLNDEIERGAKNLSDLLAKQRELSETQSIAGKIDRSLMDFIACWADSRHVFEEEAARARAFKNFVLPDLTATRKKYWSPSYWPSIADLLRAIEVAARDNWQESTDPLNIAALCSRESSKLDFLRALLTALDQDRNLNLIPQNFSFTNKSLTAVVNCAFGLVEDPYTESAMKKAVQRLRNKNDQGDIS